MMNRYFNVSSLTDKQKGQALLCVTGLDGWKRASEGFFFRSLQVCFIIWNKRGHRAKRTQSLISAHFSSSHFTTLSQSQSIYREPAFPFRFFTPTEGGSMYICLFVSSPVSIFSDFV